MKRLLTILLTIFVSTTALAKIEHTIIIDEGTFKPVQKDNLTGLNIDPISKDSSRNPCARVKIQFHKMTLEQMEQLEPVFPSGIIDCPKFKVTENAVLILEFTAKPNVKFYLKHPTFGTSNEVEFSFEGDKEYQLEATLNQLYSIVVRSNEVGADVYIDDVYKGKTDNSKELIVEEVTNGDHKLKLTLDKRSSEMDITVNPHNISFSLDVAEAKTEYVVFNVIPANANASVTIDGHTHKVVNGHFNKLLEVGTHEFTVSAPDYHSETGTIVVKEGSKAIRTIQLKNEATTVTITAPNDAEIWINNEKKSIGTWTGALQYGYYIFEARKEGHRPEKRQEHIYEKRSEQTFTLEAPKPMLGSLMIEGSQTSAKVTLDGKEVGTLPLKLKDILVGEHTVVVSMYGYITQTKKVTINEGKTEKITVELDIDPSHKSHKHGHSHNIVLQNELLKKVKAFYQHGVDLGCRMHSVSGAMVNHVGVSYIGGVRATKTIFVGLGVGAEFNFDKIDNSAMLKQGAGQPLSAGTISIPLYLHARAYMGDHSRTFVALSVGGKLFGSDSIYHEGVDYKYHTNGLFADLNFGVNFGKFYISVGATTQSLPCIDAYSNTQLDIKSKMGIGAKISAGWNF